MLTSYCRDELLCMAIFHAHLLTGASTKRIVGKRLPVDYTIPGSISVSTRACHNSVRAKAGFDSPPGRLFAHTEDHFILRQPTTSSRYISTQILCPKYPIIYSYQTNTSRFSESKTETERYCCNLSQRTVQRRRN